MDESTSRTWICWRIRILILSWNFHYRYAFFFLLEFDSHLCFLQISDYVARNDAILLVIIPASQAPEVSSCKAIRIAKDYDSEGKLLCSCILDITVNIIFRLYVYDCPSVPSLILYKTFQYLNVFGKRNAFFGLCPIIVPTSPFDWCYLLFETLNAVFGLCPIASSDLRVI